MYVLYSIFYIVEYKLQETSHLILSYLILSQLLLSCLCCRCYTTGILVTILPYILHIQYIYFRPRQSSNILSGINKSSSPSKMLVVSAESAVLRAIRKWSTLLLYIQYHTTINHAVSNQCNAIQCNTIQYSTIYSTENTKRSISMLHQGIPFSIPVSVHQEVPHHPVLFRFRFHFTLTM